MKFKPDFMEDADNVYRTKNYIVKQIIALCSDDKENNSIMSFDTFYKRTKVRDMEYNLIFHAKTHPNGKRLPSTMHSRKYID